MVVVVVCEEDFVCIEFVESCVNRLYIDGVVIGYIKNDFWSLVEVIDEVWSDFCLSCGCVWFVNGCFKIVNFEICLVFVDLYES